LTNADGLCSEEAKKEVSRTTFLRMFVRTAWEGKVEAV
jgi:hypothetical protein